MCVYRVQAPAADLCKREALVQMHFHGQKGVNPSLFLPHLHSSFTRTRESNKSSSQPKKQVHFFSFSGPIRIRPHLLGRNVCGR